MYVRVHVRMIDMLVVTTVMVSCQRYDEVEFVMSMVLKVLSKLHDFQRICHRSKIVDAR